MKLFVATLLVAFSAQAQEIVNSGIYEGRNEAALIFKDCRLEIFRNSNGTLNLAAVRDSSNAYNLWVRDGGDFKLDQRSGVKVLGRQLRFTNKDAGGTSIYDARTDKNDSRAYNDYGTLDVVTNSSGNPTSFKFVYAQSKDGAAPYKPANTVQCQDLRLR